MPRLSYATSTWLFLRLLGIVYVFAFWSLAQQVRGLIGHDGILPAAEYMARVQEYVGSSGIGLDRYRLVPTLAWISTTDSFLQALAIAGAVLSLLLIAGIAQALVLPALWLLYLSFSVVGRDFLSYQWDALLLETGLLAIVLAPPRWLHRFGDPTDPPRVARWLLWWLLFRLMFGSGIVKLASGDPTWRELTAMSFHYETQPLPTPLAWYVHQLPLWAHKGATAGVFVIELLLPWLIFIGRRTRIVAAGAFVALQALIALTGNYTFFNLLTIVLCVLLLDDQAFRRTVAGARRAGPVSLALATAAAIVIVPASLTLLAGQLELPMPEPVVPLLDAIDPLRSVNPYGLFAVMTTTRPEIEIEGSLDGVTWRAYEFRYKPGSLARRPPWIAPFQPRLDWQIWFAALSRYEQETWFQAFCRRLLDGSPSVRRLLASDPFDGRRPRFIRATLYRYRFTDAGTRRSTGAWWTRERLGEYSPVLP